MNRFVDDPRALPREGDRVLVAGLGVSGVAASQAIAKMGASVAVCDDVLDDATRMHADSSNADEIVLGGMFASLLDGRDLVIASPGIRPSHPMLRAALEMELPVWSEVELGYRMTQAPLIGVTGTNGKTTTTEMVTAILKHADINAVSAGNIGLALTAAASQKPDAIVCELSSFQLHWIDQLRTKVGVLLNVAPDHLDWHGSFDAYVNDKARMFQNQQPGDVAIVLDDCVKHVKTDGTLLRYSLSSDADAGVKDGAIHVPQGEVARVSQLRVRGSAMIADAIAAAAAACAFGVSVEDAGKALMAFEPAPHRMELISRINGVTFINDSKATNPHATMAALAGLSNVVLIAGGRNKGLDLSPIGGSASVKAFVAIGESAREVESAFAHRGLPGERASSMEDAVERAWSLAKAGDTVLLAPACASLDMFDDYRHRGDAFRTAVRAIGKRLAEGGEP
ncbi:MAG: UDP-N-acetylmuramoyl-L-alanine--D-glutamate ligase [Actinomycetota bacterium]